MTTWRIGDPSVARGEGVSTTPGPRTGDELVRRLRQDYFSLAGAGQLVENTVTFLMPVIAVGAVSGILGGAALSDGNPPTSPLPPGRLKTF